MARWSTGVRVYSRRVGTCKLYVDPRPPYVNDSKWKVTDWVDLLQPARRQGA
jgi:hypothetical protein